MTVLRTITHDVNVNDLLTHCTPAERLAIIKDLCETSGGGEIEAIRAVINDPAFR